MGFTRVIPASYRDGNILVVLPAFNEELSIGRILADLPDLPGVQYMVVDDYSGDRTGQIAATHDVVVLRTPRRLGRAGAVAWAIGQANPEHIALGLIVMDTDGQHEANDVPQFVDGLRSGKRLVVGNRFGKLARQNWVPADRYFLAKVLSGAILEIAGVRISDPGCGFLGIDFQLWETLSGHLEYGPHLTMEIVIRAVQLSLVSECEILEVQVPAVYSLDSPRHIDAYSAGWEERLSPRMMSHLNLLYTLMSDCFDSRGCNLCVSSCCVPLNRR